MIVNPVCVPPFLRVDLDAVELHREVDVVASGHAGHAAQAHHLALLHHVAFMDIDPAEVAIDRLQSVAVVDDDAVAVNSQRSRIDDLAVIRGFHADMLRHRQVVSQMNLLIDLLAVIDVIAHIGKVRFRLRVRLPA